MKFYIIIEFNMIIIVVVWYGYIMVLLFTEATTTPTTVPPDFDGINENYVKDTIVLTF